jgi:hypothetical protein
VSLPVDDEAIAAWVRTRLAVLDTTPRDRLWRKRALGVARSVAIASAPKWGYISFPIPPAEMSVLRRRAEARGMSVQGYVKAAVATALVACDGIERDDIPTLSGPGLVGPR